MTKLLYCYVSAVKSSKQIAGACWKAFNSVSGMHLRCPIFHDFGFQSKKSFELPYSFHKNLSLHFSNFLAIYFAYKKSHCDSSSWHRSETPIHDTIVLQYFCLPYIFLIVLMVVFNCSSLVSVSLFIATEMDLWKIWIT